jgi:hypothetical protein
VHNTFAVEVTNSQRNLCSVELHDFFTQTFLRFKNFVEFTTFDKWHNEVKSLWGLKKIIHSNKERVVTAEKDIFLQLGVLYLVVLDKYIFSDCLNSVKLLLLDKLSKIYFAERSSAEQHFKLEIFILDI